MRVVRQKYYIDGKIFDDLSTLQDLKEGTVIESVLVVEELKEEDKSGVKINNNDDKGTEDK